MLLLVYSKALLQLLLILRLDSKPTDQQDEAAVGDSLSGEQAAVPALDESSQSALWSRSVDTTDNSEHFHEIPAGKCHHGGCHHSDWMGWFQLTTNISWLMKAEGYFGLASGMKVTCQECAHPEKRLRMVLRLYQGPPPLQPMDQCWTESLPVRSLSCCSEWHQLQRSELSRTTTEESPKQQQPCPSMAQVCIIRLLGNVESCLRFGVNLKCNTPYTCILN